MLNPLALYIHWPFCLSKCPYCDFNSHVAETIDHDRMGAAYLKALEHYAALVPKRALSSVYFGGGTPSLMKPKIVGDILAAAHRCFGFTNDIEITLEANPTSIEAAKLEGFKAAGVNRVSIGVQALDDASLKFLGREHSVKEARKAVEIAAGIFDRFSFDLIYARPEQSLEDWKEELSRALALGADHMSLYQLTIEQNTPFYNEYARGAFSLPEEELSAEFYNLTQDMMEKEGLPAYEVSNHAREGHESRHNLIYWRYGDYIGIGAGAHGRLTLSNGEKVATREHRAPKIWLERTEEMGSAAHPFETLGQEDQKMEALMMGLRLRGGIDIDWHGLVDEQRLQTAQKEGWLEYTDSHITLTREGTLRLNALLGYLVTELSVSHRAH